MDIGNVIRIVRAEPTIEPVPGEVPVLGEVASEPVVVPAEREAMPAERAPIPAKR